jgi:hypothetical protein
MIITEVKEQERNSVNIVKKLLFFGFIVCIDIDILRFTYFAFYIFGVLHIFPYVKVLKRAYSIVVIPEDGC